MLQLVRKLVFKFAIPDARPAGTVAKRVAGLDHELGYDAVEEHAIVVPTACGADKVFNCLGCLLREQAQVHVAQGRVDCCGGRERCCARRSGRCGGSDQLLFTGQTLVEDVLITEFRAAVSVYVTRGSLGTENERCVLAAKAQAG